MQLCAVCGEPAAIGQHPIQPLVAASFAPRPCKCCGAHSRACCVLGLGDIVYQCINGHVSGTITRPAKASC
jgi:hypothetical protein